MWIERYSNYNHIAVGFTDQKSIELLSYYEITHFFELFLTCIWQYIYVYIKSHVVSLNNMIYALFVVWENRDDKGYIESRLCSKVSDAVLLWRKPETEVWNVSTELTRPKLRKVEPNQLHP